MFHRLTLLALAPVALAAVAALSTAGAQERLPAQGSENPGPRLRREVTVESDVVRLGDLVDRCEKSCATPLFRAPAPGETGAIQAARALAAARETGLDDVEAGGVAQIAVTRPGRAATREEIDRALAQAIAARVGAETGDLSVSLSQPPARLSLAAKAEGPSVGDLVIDARNRLFTASLMAPGAPAGTAVRVAGAYVESALAPVLQRALQRGDAVRAEDVAMERRERDALPEDVAGAAAQIAGRVARISMRPGTILRERDLIKPLMIERNAAVTILLESGALQLSLRGKAVDQGALGETVSVQNVNTKRVIQGVVAGPNLVRVQPSSAGAARAASAQP